MNGQTRRQKLLVINGAHVQYLRSGFCPIVVLTLNTIQKSNEDWLAANLTGVIENFSDFILQTSCIFREKTKVLQHNSKDNERSYSDEPRALYTLCFQLPALT